MGGSRGGHSGGGGYAAHGGGGGGYAHRGGGGYAYRGGGGYARGPRYPWWGYGHAGWGGYPWWGWYGGLGWYNSSYYADNSYTAQTYPSYVYATPDSNDYSQTYRVQQDEIDRLNSEVDRLRAQGQSQSPASTSQSKTVETVLIYRDGHAEEVENYAIVGKTIWVFNETRAKKIPLADLDLPATKQDNEDRGIDFVLPNSSR